MTLEQRYYYRLLCYGTDVDPFTTEERPRMEWTGQRCEELRSRFGWTSVLDAGAGFGWLSLHLAQRGFQVTACEPSIGHLLKLRERAATYGFEVYGEFLEDLAADAGERRWDLVVLGEVIEHIEDAAAFVRSALSVCSGQVLATTPKGEWPSPEHIHVYEAGEELPLYGSPEFGGCEVIPNVIGTVDWFGVWWNSQ
jgi:2-polyprenyl-3-methyl-5-hydroxy-6-metoxy-1,4-benzoquinol methylase